MRGIETGKVRIRHEVFTEIARMAYEGGDYAKRLEELPFKIIPGEIGSYRDSLFLERAVVGERLRLAIGDMPDGWKANNAWAKMGVLAVEMEAAALYMNAARAGKRALAICTVSDQLVRQEFTTSEERQTGFTQMMQLALETAIKLEK